MAYMQSPSVDHKFAFAGFSWKMAAATIAEAIILVIIAVIYVAIMGVVTMFLLTRSHPSCGPVIPSASGSVYVSTCLLASCFRKPAIVAARNKPSYDDERNCPLFSVVCVSQSPSKKRESP